MNEIIKSGKKAKIELDKLKEEMLSCNQDRSFYQLEKFVIGQNDTPERRYLQLMTELYGCYMEIRRVLLDIEECEIERKKSKGIRRKRAELKMDGFEYNLDAKLKEFGKLMIIKKQIPSFTMVEIEKAEEKYYLERLSRQVLEDQASSCFNINVGNLRALIQSGKIKLIRDDEKGISIIDNDLNKLEMVNDDAAKNI